MMLTIAILAGLGYLISIFRHLSTDEPKLDVDLPISIILVLSTWESCLPLAIIVIILTIMIGIVGAAINPKY